MQQEFQVIILAGGTGSRLYPLTQDAPKSLLPVANRPLISYQLEILERAGFTETIILTTSEVVTDLKKYILEIYKGKLQVTWEVQKTRVGTVEALLKIKDKIKSNFIVISGDALVQETSLHNMADIHRTRDAALTMLLKKKAPLTEEEKKSLKGKNPVSDYIGLDDSGRVLYFTAAADLEENLLLKKSLLKSHLSLTIHSNLLDAHLYVFSKWVLNLLEAHPNLQSIKGEVIPFLIRLQLRKQLQNGDIPQEVLYSKSVVNAMSSTLSFETDRLGCFAYVIPEDVFAIRVNTLESYLEANREVAKGTTGFLPTESVGKQNFIASTSQVSPKTQVGPECIVGASTVIGDKCSVKKSIIGKHCKIGNQVKLINSVIMNYVTIMDNCTIQNSIICNNVFFNENCSIKDCQVGAFYNFEPKSDNKSEILVNDEDVMIGSSPHMGQKLK